MRYAIKQTATEEERRQLVEEPQLNMRESMFTLDRRVDTLEHTIEKIEETLLNHMRVTPSTDDNVENLHDTIGKLTSANKAQSRQIRDLTSLVAHLTRDVEELRRRTMTAGEQHRSATQTHTVTRLITSQLPSSPAAASSASSSRTPTLEYGIRM